MPVAAYRPCAGGCGARVPKGKCPKCSRRAEHRRGTASHRGYNNAWVHFRPYFINMLVEHGIVPACGAVLPGGPQTLDSTCKAQGWVTMASLHLDHEPPLTDQERRDPHIVCDPFRIQLLCRSDHQKKTSRENNRYA